MMVAEGRFREDLYYRISVFPVTLPPLRERAGDVALLARTFLAELAPDKTFEARALERLSEWRWPGNIRELRNVIQRAVLLADGPRILPHHLPRHVGAPLPARPPQAPAAGGGFDGGTEVRPLADIEADYLAWAARTFPGSRRELARALGVSERTLYRRLRALDLLEG
jgi:two-component system, NtrC family, response regulator HydG